MAVTAMTASAAVIAGSVLRSYQTTTSAKNWTRNAGVRAQGRCRPTPRATATTAAPYRVSSTPSSTAVPRSSLSLVARSEEHTSELQSRVDLVCRLLLEKKKKET